MNEEKKLIQKMQKLFATHSAAFRSSVLIGDDTAFLSNDFFRSEFFSNAYPPPLKKNKIQKNEKSSGMLFTTDTLAQDVHFRWEWSSPQEVAQKLIEMNVSDIYAKGGKPTFALLNISITNETLHSRMSQFLLGIKKTAKKHNMFIIGGDTTSSQRDVFTLTLAGKAGQHFIGRRNENIQVGDIVALMGFPGYSNYALDMLNEGKPVTASFKKAHTAPVAQTKTLQWLFNLQTLASIDQSDSLYQSLEILSKENNVGFYIDISNIPSFTRLKKIDFDYVQHIVSGGEDFSVLAILPFAKKSAALAYAKKEKSFAVIGEVLKKRSLIFFERGKKISFEKENDFGFEHFK